MWGKIVRDNTHVRHKVRNKTQDPTESQKVNMGKRHKTSPSTSVFKCTETWLEDIVVWPVSEEKNRNKNKDWVSCPLKSPLFWLGCRDTKCLSVNKHTDQSAWPLSLDDIIVKSVTLITFAFASQSPVSFPHKFLLFWRVQFVRVDTMHSLSCSSSPPPWSVWKKWKKGAKWCESKMSPFCIIF